MIQIISDNTNLRLPNTKVHISLISEPNSLDEYEINIIDLNYQYLWYHSESDYLSINMIKDLDNLSTMIKQSKLTKNLIILPQNHNFKYDFSGYLKKYQKQIELKNMLSQLTSRILFALLKNDKYSLHYENTKTNINGYDVEAAFYFIYENDVLTKSNKSEKVTTIEIDNTILTTLNILKNQDILFNYLSCINLLKVKNEYPEWLKQLSIFDDQKQKQIKVEKQLIIEESKSEIEYADQKLAENNYYKSILISNGEQLAEVVFKTLEKLLNCDLSGFIDLKKEDFNVKVEGVTFIGEIKGITSNVKSGNVSQLDVHYQTYMDTLTEQNTQENVKALLIINHQRTKPIEEREKINEEQIKLAKRNGSLIIETITLLNLYEKSINNELTVEHCINLFKDNTGLLKY